MTDSACEGQEYFSAVETLLIDSQFVHQTFKVQVMLPARKRGESARFPVVYLTDGNFAFDALKGIANSLQTLERNAPRFILVGIGYPSDSPKAGVMLRCRDFTFPGYPRFSTSPPSIEGVLVAEKGTKEFDGADDFQQFLDQELIPLIDEKYDSIAGDRTYFGHSAGGGFGLYTLFTRSELFNRYIISSAATTYHGRTSTGDQYEQYDFLIRVARRFLESGGCAGDATVYLSVGSEEEFEPGLQEWQLTSSFYRLAALLTVKSIPGLKVISEVLPGETHMTVWPIAFMHGIQAVFGTGRWSRR